MAERIRERTLPPAPPQDLRIDWFLLSGLTAIATGCHTFFDFTAAYDVAALRSPWGIGFALALATMFLRPVQKLWELALQALALLVLLGILATGAGLIYYFFFYQPEPQSVPQPAPVKMSPARPKR